MSRLHNFSAGPAVLPESVVEQTRDALWELDGCGQGLMETSHRGKAFDAVIVRARERLARLLGVEGTHEVLFLHGGARTQFFMIPLAFLGGGRATYLDTGTWAAQAADEARRYGTVDVAWSSQLTTWDAVPEPGAWGPLPEGTRYLHYTSNNTVAGSEFSYVPDSGEAWLVCDASSNILSRPVDGSRFGLIYAGAQKNLGPSGVTIVAIHKELLAQANTDVPKMLQYPLHAKKGSMYNTPATLPIFVVERVCAWIEDQGGLSVVDARNQRQADAVYGALEGSGFYRCLVKPGSRSRMNVTFTTGSDELDALFVAEATEAGLLGLKGHRSVGGLRASLYNAQTDAAVEALVAFLGDFEARRG